MKQCQNASVTFISVAITSNETCDAEIAEDDVAAAGDNDNATAVAAIAVAGLADSVGDGRLEALHLLVLAPYDAQTKLFHCLI